MGAVADAAGDAQGEFQGLFVVEARVDGGAVVAVEVGGDEVSRAAGALGDVLAGELDVHAAEAGAGRFVQLEGELELSERLRAALDSGLLRLEDLTTDGAIPIATHDMPVRQGGQAGRRIVLELAQSPAPGTVLRLTLPAGALEDDFLNANPAEVQPTWTWSGADEVVLDTRPPAISQVRIRSGRVEIELTEEVDPQSANSTVTIDGEPTTWDLAEDRYTLRSLEEVSPGGHTVSLVPGIEDLAGRSQPEQLDVTFPAGLSAHAGYRRPDPTVIPTTSAANAYGFHGHEADPATGLVYMRNRWYDPQMGRFVTADPLGYVDGPSAYGFAGSDPINQSDPLGLCTGTLCIDYQDFRPQIIKSRRRAEEARTAACRRDPMQAMCFGVVSQALLRTYGDRYALRLPPQGASRPGVFPALFVNGIQNLMEDAISRSALLSETFGMPVIPVWNPTFERSKAGALADVGQVFFVDKLNLPDASVRLVTETMRELLDNRPAAEPLVVFAHSQGAAIVSAAASYLTPEEQARLEVVTFGEAAWTYPGGIGSLSRFVNGRDVVPVVAGSGAYPVARGRVLLPMRFGVHGLEEYVESYRWAQSEEYQSLLRAQRLRHEELRRREIERNLGKR